MSGSEKDSGTAEQKIFFWWGDIVSDSILGGHKTFFLTNSL